MKIKKIPKLPKIFSCFFITRKKKSLGTERKKMKKWELNSIHPRKNYNLWSYLRKPRRKLEGRSSMPLNRSTIIWSIRDYLMKYRDVYCIIHLRSPDILEERKVSIFYSSSYKALLSSCFLLSCTLEDERHSIWCRPVFGIGNIHGTRRFWSDLRDFSFWSDIGKINRPMFSRGNCTPRESINFLLFCTNSENKICDPPFDAGWVLPVLKIVLSTDHKSSDFLLHRPLPEEEPDDWFHFLACPRSIWSFSFSSL